MKKALSLALVVLMVVAAFAVFAVSSSAEETTGTVYGTGLEVWKNSNNDPWGNDECGVVQILFCPQPWNGDYYKAGLEMTINMKANDGSSDDTFTTRVSTVYNGGTWGICRFEPTLMDTPWVPVKDVAYTGTFTFVNPENETVTVTADSDFVLSVDPIAPQKLGGYVKAAGFTIGYVAGSDKLTLAYDFDVAPVVSKNFWENKDNYKFSVTWFDAEGKEIKTTKTAPVAAQVWADTDVGLYFELPFDPEYQAGYGIRIVVANEDGSELYYVVEKYAEADGKCTSGAQMAFKAISEDVSGTIEGTEITWKIDAATKTLTIDGTGEMPDYSGSGDVPWADYKGDLKALVVKGGVTHVGKNTASSSGIQTATFEEGVQVIGMDAIAYCGSLTTVYLPKSLTEIKQGTVYSSNGITAANYAGSEEDWANVTATASYNDNIKNHLVFNVPVPGTQDPVEPTPVEPTPVEPTPAGEYTVVLVVLAVVALFGTALVTKKVFSK